MAKRTKKNAAPVVEAPPVVETPAAVPEPEILINKNVNFDDLEGVSITSTGKATKQVKPEYEQIVEQATASVGVPGGKGIEKILDEHRKLLYVVDRSGSMADGMRDEEQLDAYIFPDEKLKALRVHLKKMEKASKAVADVSDEEEQAFADMGEQMQLISELSDNELKAHIIASGKAAGRWGSEKLIFEGFEFPINSKTKHNSKTKMQALKGAAKKFVATRFQQHKDAMVGLMAFEDSSEILAYAGASEEEVLKAFDSLPDSGGGGTNIYQAVREALSEFKARPSLVGANHMVLVSDGLDLGATKVENMLETMKGLTLVFDFIYLQGSTPDQEGEVVAKVLRRVCEATGGEYTVVKTNQDFEVKFLAVSNRPLLPPARS